MMIDATTRARGFGLPRVPVQTHLKNHPPRFSSQTDSFTPAAKKPAKRRFGTMLAMLGASIMTLGAPVNTPTSPARGDQTTAVAQGNTRGGSYKPYWEKEEDKAGGSYRSVRAARLPSENITWPKNVKVIASSGMDYTSAFSFGEDPYGYYTESLLKVMRENDTVRTLEDAHAILEAQGYNTSSELMYPAATLRKLGSWDKGEKKERFAVLIGQLEDYDWDDWGDYNWEEEETGTQTPDSETSTPPSQTTPPTGDSTEGTPPASGGSTTTPPSGENTTPPTGDSTEGTPPATGENTTPPTGDSTEGTPPSADNAPSAAEKPPAQGTKPAAGENKVDRDKTPPPERLKDAYSTFDKSIIHDLDNLETLLQDPEYYNMPQNHILRFNNASKKDLEKGIKWLKDKLSKHPGAEVIIQYSGHGDTSYPKKTDLEGDTEGELCGPDMKETELKKLIEEHLGKFLTDPEKPAKILILLDTCHSGSFTAMNEKAMKDKKVLIAKNTHQPQAIKPKGAIA